MTTFWPDFAYKISEDGKKLTLSKNGVIETYELLDDNKQIAKISSDGNKTTVSNVVPKKGQNGVWYEKSEVDNEQNVWKTTIANAVTYGRESTPVDLTVEFHKGRETKIFGKQGTLTYDFKYEKSLYYCKLATEDRFKDQNRDLQEAFNSVANDTTSAISSIMKTRRASIVDSEDDNDDEDDAWTD